MDRLAAMQAFVRVVELGSFSRAAQELGVGQPAVTKMVAQLERHLGSRLLHRSTRGVTVTEVGALYHEQCRRIAHQVEEADNVALLMQSQLQGMLRISTSVAFGRRVLAPMVMSFLREYPQLQIDLSCDDRYVNLVEQGVDVALRMGRLADSSLGSRYLADNPWVVVAAPQYIERHGRPRTPQDLRHHAALVYSTVQGDAHWRFTHVPAPLASKKREGAGQLPSSATDISSTAGAAIESDCIVQGPLRSNNLSGLLSAARSGMGIAAVPLYVAYNSIRQGSVQTVLDDWRLPSQEIHAVYPSPRLVPTKVSVFVSWLQGQFGEHWWTALR